MLAIVSTIILGAGLSYVAVQAGMVWAGSNTKAQAVVILLASATGFILPWALISAVVNLFFGEHHGDRHRMHGPDGLQELPQAGDRDHDQEF